MYFWLNSNEYFVSRIFMVLNEFLYFLEGRGSNLGNCYFTSNFFFFWLHLQHVEVPGPGIEPALHLWPAPQLW